MRRFFILALALSACAVPPKAPPAFERVPVTALEGFGDSAMLPALEAFVSSCGWLTGGRDLPLGTQADWRPLCTQAETVATEDEALRFFAEHFDAVRIDGGGGLMTGYFEPVYAASSEPTGTMNAPVLGAPGDLVAVDLGAFRDDLKGRRIAGRVQNGRLVPYADRAAIEAQAPQFTDILGYMHADDLFFLQIQGSGVLEFPEGGRRVGYAAQNGHPYHAIGRTLVDQGHLPLEDVSMQSIRAWLGQAASDDARQVRASNPSYVFFVDRGPADSDDGPLGTAGVPLTAMASVAVDSTRIPLGAPVFISGESELFSIRALTIAQDTGGAIRGPGRVDLFVGRGSEAGETAGRLKLPVSIVVLIPRGAELPEPAPGT